MVCLSSRSPHAPALLRKAARIADRLGAPWYAVYIQTPRESPENVDAATQREVGNNLDLARQLGGTSLAFKGADLISTITAFVKEYGITHVVLGRSRQPLLSPLVRAFDPGPLAAGHSRRRRDRGRQHAARALLIAEKAHRGWSEARLPGSQPVLVRRPSA